LKTVHFTFLIGAASTLAGFLGSLTGLGGGVVIVPLLTLVFKIDMHYAIGASLVSVIATSTGAAVAYVRDGFTNIRVGMFLEIATTLGSLLGAFLAGVISTSLLAVIFGIVLLYSAYVSFREPSHGKRNDRPDLLAVQLKMDGSYPTKNGFENYHVQSVPLGFGLASIAGTLAGLLGIGAGALKVVAMDQIMRLPFKVSTATSNFMIGVTAAASIGVYLSRGYVDPGLSMPVMLGVTLGSWIGARQLLVAETEVLRMVFGSVILVLALEMVFFGLTGRI
jgi:uncharacterized membrane protein YfcA